LPRLSYSEFLNVNAADSRYPARHYTSKLSLLVLVHNSLKGNLSSRRSYLDGLPADTLVLRYGILDHTSQSLILNAQVTASDPQCGVETVLTLSSIRINYLKFIGRLGEDKPKGGIARR